ncbi:unnamed protein product [Euphydryas editha]|uniref:Ion transport domain-containing protein n=1 Tax=Euphydryas editha TaxID=104508 RepID=A0AAU9TQK9_EUPED|nr:unnamed protein product [Euphydryas editha]
MVGLENFELAGIKSYTRFWGLLMFGSYSVINVIVLLNLLIAMMSNSYAIIDQHSDVEWKFARTRLWMSYFEESTTLPPPFNIFPTPKLVMKLFGLRKKNQLKKLEEQKEKDDVRYTAVMRALVWRYVSAMHRRMVDDPVTEDHINELKGDVSALRYELLEVFEKNGMDVSFTDRKGKTVLAKRMKVWERRLMKDFQVTPVSVEDDGRPVHEDSLARFRRIAKMAAAAASGSKWDQTLAATGISSQIGRCRTRQSFKKQQNLQRAIEEARKLVLQSPIPGSRAVSPIEMPATPGHTILELIKDISTEINDQNHSSTSMPRSPKIEPGPSMSVPTVRLLTPNGIQSRSYSPIPRASSPTPSKISSTSVSVRERIPSPGSRPVSPSGSDKCLPEPSPLKAQRVSGGGSPPRVVKKKSPAHPQQQTENVVDVRCNDRSEAIAVARPLALDIKPVKDALPPPPPYTKNKTTVEVGPNTSNKHPVPMPRSRSPSPNPERAVNTINVSSSRLLTSTSTELLIPPSPVALPPGKKIDEVKTIKRQPKTGWL